MDENPITQHMGPDVIPASRRDRQNRIRGVGSYLRPGNDLDNNSRVFPTRVVRDLLSELSDVTAERDAGRHGWDEASEQFAALQDETTTEVRRLRTELTAERERMIQKVAEIQNEATAAMDQLRGEAIEERRRMQELDVAHGARLAELLEAKAEVWRMDQELIGLRTENQRLRSGAASGPPFSTPKPPTRPGPFTNPRSSWDPNRGPRPQQHPDNPFTTPFARPNYGWQPVPPGSPFHQLFHNPPVGRDALPPEVAQQLDMDSGGRPALTKRRSASSGRGSWSSPPPRSSRGCSPPGWWRPPAVRTPRS